MGKRGAESSRNFVGGTPPWRRPRRRHTAGDDDGTHNAGEDDGTHTAGDDAETWVGFDEAILDSIYCGVHRSPRMHKQPELEWDLPTIEAASLSELRTHFKQLKYGY